MSLHNNVCGGRQIGPPSQSRFKNAEAQSSTGKAQKTPEVAKDAHIFALSDKGSHALAGDLSAAGGVLVPDLCVERIASREPSCSESAKETQKPSADSSHFVLPGAQLV